MDGWRLNTGKNGLKQDCLYSKQASMYNIMLIVLSWAPPYHWLQSHLKTDDCGSKLLLGDNSVNTFTPFSPHLLSP